MKRLLLLALATGALLLGCDAAACEKHLNGHQTSSETDQEAGRR